MYIKKYIYLNFLREKFKWNLIWLNNMFNLKILLVIKYEDFKEKNSIKKLKKKFVYQNGLKFLYLRFWFFFGIRYNLIWNLLKI